MSMFGQADFDEMARAMFLWTVVLGIIIALVVLGAGAGILWLCQHVAFQWK